MNLGPRGLAGKAFVRRLEWDCAEELALFEPPYDVVVAGDCLYEEACILPLLKTMWALSGPNTEVCFMCRPLLRAHPFLFHLFFRGESKRC